MIHYFPNMNTEKQAALNGHLRQVEGDTHLEKVGILLQVPSLASGSELS